MKIGIIHSRNNTKTLAIIPKISENTRKNLKTGTIQCENAQNRNNTIKTGTIDINEIIVYN